MKIQPESRNPAFATRKAAVLKTAAALGLASTFAIQSCDITENGGLAGDPVMPPVDYSSSDVGLSSSSSVLETISSSSSSALAGMSYAQMPESSSSSVNDSITTSSSSEMTSSSSIAFETPKILLPPPDPYEEHPPLSGLVAPGTYPPNE